MEVADKPETVFENNTGCQVLHILLHYFLVCSYFWMFSEGLYLHTLLVVAFVSEERLMKWFYLLGWGAPAIIVAVYAAVRGSSTPDTQHCWIEESHYTLILSTPVCASILANLVFLINIVRVLVTKLRANHLAATADTSGTRKAVRATLILIPLLGLHYVLMPFRPAPGSNGELVYQVVSALVSSFQGFCVALLFCFCNSEVALAVKKRWQQFQFNRGPTTISFTNTCVVSLNGSQGRASSVLRKSSALRTTFTRAQHRSILEIPGESPWANTRSIVMDNPSRSVVEEEDYFGSREDCAAEDQRSAELRRDSCASSVDFDVGGALYATQAERSAVRQGCGDIVVETHCVRGIEGDEMECPNIIVVKPDRYAMLESGTGMSGGEGSCVGEGRRGGLLNAVSQTKQIPREVLELKPVKATVHQC